MTRTREPCLGGRARVAQCTASTLVGVTDIEVPSVRTLVERHREEIRAAASRYRGRRVRLFGSAARGEDRPESDVDVLVDFEPGSSLFDVLHLTEELEHILGRSVDVVSAGGLKPRDQHIVDEAVDQ
jgi:uncharacterized protein